MEHESFLIDVLAVGSKQGGKRLAVALIVDLNQRLADQAGRLFFGRSLGGCGRRRLGRSRFGRRRLGARFGRRFRRLASAGRLLLFVGCDETDGGNCHDRTQRKKDSFHDLLILSQSAGCSLAWPASQKITLFDRRSQRRVRLVAATGVPGVSSMHPRSPGNPSGATQFAISNFQFSFFNSHPPAECVLWFRSPSMHRKATKKSPNG